MVDSLIVERGSLLSLVGRGPYGTKNPVCTWTGTSVTHQERLRFKRIYVGGTSDTMPCTRTLILPPKRATLESRAQQIKIRTSFPGPIPSLKFSTLKTVTLSKCYITFVSLPRISHTHLRFGSRSGRHREGSTHRNPFRNVDKK